MYAFGSRATEVAACARAEPAAVLYPDSDVDIGVLPAYGRPLNAQERVALAAALEDALDVSRVDLVILPEADPFLAANVIRGERLYARDSDEADEYELCAAPGRGSGSPGDRTDRADPGEATMMTGQMSAKIVADRLAWIAAMLGEIRALPLGDAQAFFADRRNV